MQLLRPSKPSLVELFSARFPAAQAAGPVSAIGGLSGHSLAVTLDGELRVARMQSADKSGLHLLRRQWRALKQMPAELAPAPYCYCPPWLVVNWLVGDTCTVLPDTAPLAALLAHLHHQPLFGWRVRLLPSLQRYWQQSDPARRTIHWWRALKKCHQLGEPRGLRLAPLHMDIHPGNLILTDDGLRLIDWEYAGDGDIALELATLMLDNPGGEELLTAYSAAMNINREVLYRQVRRWLPWVCLLMASWYEWRWHQTRSDEFIRLADPLWRRLRTWHKEERL